MRVRIAELIKKILPEFFYNRFVIIYRFFSVWVFKIKLKKIQINHQKALIKVRKKDKIKVVFFLIHESVWKYEGLYKLMEQDERFAPLVIICPDILYGEDLMLKEMNLAYGSFQDNGYKVIKTLDDKTGEWLDVKNEIKPDLVFFTNPWNLTKKQYRISNYLDTLTSYVPYGFKNSYLYQVHFNQLMQNFVWTFFLETIIHQKLSRKYARNKGVNTYVSGYPGMDSMLDETRTIEDPWKIKDKSIKRIIWAPHHTIPGYGGDLDYSTFMEYYDFMFQVVEKYKGKAQFAFKPHPVLKAKLSKDEVWGKEKTDAYYSKWDELENGQLIKGEYIDLFLTSDGMFHDSSSFVIEYLYTKKPVMFLMEDEKIDERFNEIGKRSLKECYHGKKREDIEFFIEEVVLKGKDSKKQNRVDFFNSLIKPPNDLIASQNIFNYIKNKLFKE